jgi:ketosteroid isomerase-like protein
MDNVELIRAGYDAFVRRDRDWLYANVTPDIEWHPAMGPLLKQSVYRGPQEVESVIWDEIPGVLAGFTAEVIEVERLDDERVLGIVKFKGTAVSTGMEIEQLFAQIFTARDGKVAEMRSYSSKEQALAAIAETKPA